MESGLPKLSAKLDALIRKGLLDRLPVTFSAFWFEQFRDWELLFPAEKDYYERLFSLLDRSEKAAVDQLFAPLREVESRMGVSERTWPRRAFTLDQVDFLNRSPYYAQWRRAVGDIFARLDPLLDEEVAKRGERRLVVVIAPAELPVGADRMWTRLRGHGHSVTVAPPENPDDYLALLLTGSRRSSAAPAIADLYAARSGNASYRAWLVETGSVLAGLGSSGQSVIRCSYDGLERYRARLVTEVDRLVRDGGISGPRQLGERLKQLKIAPAENALAQDPVLAEFARATLLSGNGTLLINNTFVEWATAQAARRARPHLLVAAFGIRNKIKPFSGLLMYADQDKANPIPTQADILGSYVDLEVLYEYVWRQFEKYPEYRAKTAYLFAADGMEEMCTIAPAEFLSDIPAGRVPLLAIHRLMKDWLSLA